MADLEEDARNEKNLLRRALDAIESHCLEKKKKINAFLIRREATEGSRTVPTLSDLRLLHLLHQTIFAAQSGRAIRGVHAGLLVYGFQITSEY